MIATFWNEEKRQETLDYIQPSETGNGGQPLLLTLVEIEPLGCQDELFLTVFL